MRPTKHHRRTQISGQFAPKLIEMLEAPAYRVLSLSARRIIERIEIELGHHGGKDNGRLIVTYDDFKSYGIHRHAIAPAIREAVALGFLEITGRGRAGNAKWRSPNTFRLTYRASQGLPGDGSHEWRRIATVEAADAIARAARTKNISQCRKTPLTSDGNRHWRGDFPVPETITTSIVRKPSLLSISRGGRVGILRIGMTRRRPPGGGGNGGASA